MRDRNWKVTVRDDGSRRVQTIFRNPSRVRAEFKDQCDINVIMKKYGNGEPVTHLNKKGGMYGDFTGIKDLQSAMATVHKASTCFNALPAEVRKRFKHDPQEVLNFIADSSNREEAIKLGLIKPQVPAKDATINDASKAEPPKG